MKIISWNINGIRAAQKKGFLEWLYKESPDIVCVQEIKAQEDQLDMAIRNPEGYFVYFNPAERKGYSGVATFTKQEPLSVEKGFGVDRFDSEGRVLTTEFEDFFLLNIYFPNGQRDGERLKYKMDFYEETMRYVDMLKKTGKEVITLGDYNTAHKEIDLARPKENANRSGFLPIECAWLDKWVESGQIDIFREFNSEPDQYTWWDQKTRARERNVGWRIDYHFITEGLRERVKDAKIMADVMGSDHCPISLELHA